MRLVDDRCPLAVGAIAKIDRRMYVVSACFASFPTPRRPPNEARELRLESVGEGPGSPSGEEGGRRWRDRGEESEGSSALKEKMTVLVVCLFVDGSGSPAGVVAVFCFRKPKNDS